MEDVKRDESVVRPNVLKHHYCAACGAVSSQGIVEGVLSWICPDPDCGFIEPVT